MRALVVMMTMTVACGDNRGPNINTFMWDDHRVLCSAPLDDLTGTPLNWTSVERQISQAEEFDWVAIFHMHTPGATVAIDTIDRVLTLANQYHLTPVTFRELVPSAPHVPSIALAFDDNASDQWFQIRELLAQHEFHVTFFVAHFDQMTPQGKDELAALASDGHDVEPHTVNHLYGPDYVAANGMDAYLANEVLPSFQMLVDAGYPQPAAFAYPFGDHTPAMDAAILPYAQVLRSVMDGCPE